MNGTRDRPCPAHARTCHVGLHHPSAVRLTFYWPTLCLLARNSALRRKRRAATKAALSAPTATGRPYSRSMCNKPRDASTAAFTICIRSTAASASRQRRSHIIICNGNVALLSYASPPDDVIRVLYIYKYSKRYYVRAVYLCSDSRAVIGKKISFAAGSTPARHRDTLFSVARARCIHTWHNII